MKHIKDNKAFIVHTVTFRSTRPCVFNNKVDEENDQYPTLLLDFMRWRSQSSHSDTQQNVVKYY